MSKPVITAEHWMTYRACQEIGFFNMLDYESWANLWSRLPSIEWPFGKLTRDEWFEIIKNYTYYKKQFKKYEEDAKENCPHWGAGIDDIQNS